MKCDWKKVHLSDLAVFKNGKKRPQTDGAIPVYGGNGILAYTAQNNFSNCISIGRVGAYCGNIFLSEDKCWISDNAIAVIPKQDISIYFLYYLLKNLQLNKLHIGSGQPLLTQGILNSIEICVPNKKEQNKIADILLTFDRKIEINKKINKYILTPDSIIISKLNPSIKRIWRPICLSAHPVCSTEFIVYEAKKKAQRDYIYSIIDSVAFLNYLCSHTTGSTNSRQRATPKNTLNYSMFLPPDFIIDDFCNIITPIYDLIASNIIENQSLAHTRDTLLPRLMSGELDMSNIDL